MSSFLHSRTTPRSWHSSRQEGVARLTLGHENSYNAAMPEFRQALPVAEYLAETDPELMFLVLSGDALDFRHEDGPVLLPCQVKVRSRRP